MMTDAQLKARDAGRDIGAELLQSVREMKAGQWARKTTFEPLADGSVRRSVLRGRHTGKTGGTGGAAVATDGGAGSVRSVAIGVCARHRRVGAHAASVGTGPQGAQRSRAKSAQTDQPAPRVVG